VIIVLEGVDGSGKTTLAENLAAIGRGKGFDVGVWHRGVPKRHPLEEYEWDLEQHYPDVPSERMRRLIVCDRWHLGQLVYGGLYRDENLLGVGGAWHVDAFLRSLGAVQLVLSPSLEVIRGRIAHRGEDYLKAEDVEYVWKAYRSFGELSWPDVAMLHQDDPVGDAQALGILQLAQERAERTMHLGKFPTYVGPPRPDILLLGDKRGPVAKNRVPHRTAFVPYGPTSGKWLAEAIVRGSEPGEPLHRYTIGLANAGEENVEKLLEALGYPHDEPMVVTLGNAAHRILEQRNIPHGAVPHPQYGRRFYGNEQERYAQMILEAAVDPDRYTF
jgi:thymidylate kinase